MARQLLVANGVAARQIDCINPQKSPDTALPKVDAAVNFLSCGYHYPVGTYRDYFKATVKAGGSVIVDLRRKTAAEQSTALRVFADVTEIGRVADGRGIRLQTQSAY